MTSSGGSNISAFFPAASPPSKSQLLEIRETFAQRHRVGVAFSNSIAMRLGCNRAEGRPYHGAHTKHENSSGVHDG